MPKSFTPTGNYAQNQALRKEIAEIKAKGYRKPDNFPPVKPGSVRLDATIPLASVSERLHAKHPNHFLRPHYKPHPRKGIPLINPKHLFNKQSRIEGYIKPLGPPKPRSQTLA